MNAQFIDDSLPSFSYATEVQLNMQGISDAAISFRDKKISTIGEGFTAKH